MAGSIRLGNVDNVYCDVSELPTKVQEILEEYAATTRAKMTEAVTETTKDARDIIKANANVDARSTRRKGKYKKSIRYKINEESLQTEGQVYASGHEYSLTHLLENGHRIWNSPGRRTRAFKHWKLGEDLAIDELPRKIIEKLE